MGWERPYDDPVAGGDPEIRLAGIPVQFPLSGLLGMLVIAFLWTPNFTGSSAAPDWMLGLAFAAFFALTVLIHEFSHALTARALGYPVRRVVLHFLGGFTQFDRIKTAPWREAAIAASGPIATFLVAFVAYLIGGALPDGSAGQAVAYALAWANLLMGAYNALPGLPLDGGAFVRCVIWAVTGSEERGTNATAVIGRVVAVLTLALPAYLIARFGVYTGSLVVLTFSAVVAWTLWTGASSQQRYSAIRNRAAGLTAGGLARPAIPVAPSLPLAEAVRQATAAGAGALVVVDPEGRVTGIGQQDAIAAVPEDRRAWVQVASVSRPWDPAAMIDGRTSGEELLTELGNRGRTELLVLDPDGHIAGVLLVADVEAALRT